LAAGTVSRHIGAVRVTQNVPLADLTTLRLGGPARRLVAPDREQDVIDTVRAVDARGERLLIVGGGSNLVVGDAAIEGTVLRMATRRVAFAPSPDGTVHITAAAGEPWDDLVAHVVAEGLAGMECLAGIPGLVGAVPMQNVGAYGQDVSETVVSVRTWDRAARRVAIFDRAACRFAYRSSVFRGGEGHVILGVTFALAKRATSTPLRYAELTRTLGIAPGESAPLLTTRETVIALRRAKGMVLDPGDLDTASAGSFFTNPILDAAALAALRQRVGGAGESMPVFPEADGRAKVSAAWLIERAGFAKGFAMGRVAISSKHALALTNRGEATTAELLALARAIRDRVRARFGVMLAQEPVFVGAVL
jgi:UDP-N-acetylmuramate dehydrogenase